MTDFRVTQTALETLTQPTPVVRVTQQVIELLSGAPKPVQLTQAVIELLTSAASQGPAGGTSMPMTSPLNLGLTTDENGALRAVVDTTGTITGPLTNFGNLRLRTDATGALVVASGTAGALSTQPMVFPNLRGRTNDAGALMVAAASAGAVQGPPTALGNLRLRTDENGALKVAPSAAGSLIGPLTPLANLRVRTDENGALLMSGLVAETYSSRVLADGAFAYWRFVETTGPVLDSADSLNGTINGTVTRGVAGAILSAPTDFAISVAGAGRIDLPVMTLPAICSVEAWVKTPLSSGFHVIWTNRNATVSTNPTFLLENGQPQFAMNGITVAPPVFRIDDGLWHHVVATSSGTELSIYIDGVFFKTQPAVTTASAAQPGVIGWDNFGGFATLTIDNLALYPIVLTATQVTNHYHLAGY
jgi:hypothetical protein